MSLDDNDLSDWVFVQPDPKMEEAHPFVASWDALVGEELCRRYKQLTTQTPQISLDGEGVLGKLQLPDGTTITATLESFGEKFYLRMKRKKQLISTTIYSATSYDFYEAIASELQPSLLVDGEAINDYIVVWCSATQVHHQTRKLPGVLSHLLAHFKPSKSKSSPMEILNPDMWLYVLQYLDAPSLCNTLETCSFFYGTFHEEQSLWKSLLFRDFAKILPTIGGGHAHGDKSYAELYKKNYTADYVALVGETPDAANKFFKSVVVTAKQGAFIGGTRFVMPKHPNWEGSYYQVGY